MFSFYRYVFLLTKRKSKEDLLINTIIKDIDFINYTKNLDRQIGSCKYNFENYKIGNSLDFSIELLEKLLSKKTTEEDLKSISDQLKLTTHPLLLNTWIGDTKNIYKKFHYFLYLIFLLEKKNDVSMLNEGYKYRLINMYKKFYMSFLEDIIIRLNFLKER